MGCALISWGNVDHYTFKTEEEVDLFFRFKREPKLFSWRV